MRILCRLTRDILLQIVVSDAVQYMSNQLRIVTGHGEFQHPALFTALANGKGFLQGVNRFQFGALAQDKLCSCFGLNVRDSQRNAIFFQTLADHTIDGELFTFQRIVAVFPNRQRQLLILTIQLWYMHPADRQLTWFLFG